MEHFEKCTMVFRRGISIVEANIIFKCDLHMLFECQRGNEEEL